MSSDIAAPDRIADLEDRLRAMTIERNEWENRYFALAYERIPARNNTSERAQELLEANNRYLQRARDSEDLVDEMLAALKSLGPILDEIHDKWDQGMKSGNLLIALLDPTLGYRSDISAIHAVIEKAKQAKASP
ncbi:hypothetical protein SAMN02745157_1426 [Kaistia soli DSM 19436]|uniref:Uncharacterized protein n=1 Tax=Kaistia soli DSM 19436 TaxID=1122133 RepID=A0A1M4Y4X8_9HYPH|nr:hypothetical protein [Kaistia soli]SHF00811.1 hypothetical protein SAMN02745157_1426 [Kaistia soli DSM 19436]